jgi:hypothetical protein
MRNTLDLYYRSPNHLKKIYLFRYYINVPSFEIQNVFKMRAGVYPYFLHLLFSLFSILLHQGVAECLTLHLCGEFFKIWWSNPTKKYFKDLLLIVY